MDDEAETTIMWAITGRLGLYCGTFLTRKDAIYDFTKAMGFSWKACRKMGNRAIKVKVVEVKP